MPASVDHKASKWGYKLHPLLSLYAVLTKNLIKFLFRCIGEKEVSGWWDEWWGIFKIAVVDREAFKSTHLETIDISVHIYPPTLYKKLV
jgi:hypothetical protein